MGKNKFQVLDAMHTQLVRLVFTDVQREQLSTPLSDLKTPYPTLVLLLFFPPTTNIKKEKENKPFFPFFFQDLLAFFSFFFFFFGL